MITIELINEKITDKYIAAVKESFYDEYTSLGITKASAPSNGAFFDKGQLNRLILKGALLYVALDEGIIVGGVGCHIEGEILKIVKLFVCHDYREKGIGRELINHCFSIAKDKKLKKVTLGMIKENIKLYNYYLKYGFTECKTFYNERMGLHVAFMEKRL